MKNEPMPSGLTGAEQVLFQGLRLLYCQYHAGYIRREDAAAEKRKLVLAYEADQQKAALWQRTADLWKRLEAPMSAFRAAPSVETARRCMELLYGTRIQW